MNEKETVVTPTEEVTAEEAVTTKTSSPTEEPNEAEDKVKKYLKPSEPPKKFLFSEEIDGEIEKIKKNIDFCSEKGIPEAILPGGKWFNTFKELVNRTYKSEVAEIVSRMTGIFGENTLDYKSIYLAHQKELIDATKTADSEKLKQVLADCQKDAADLWVKKQLLG